MSALRSDPQARSPKWSIYENTRTRTSEIRKLYPYNVVSLTSKVLIAGRWSRRRRFSARRAKLDRPLLVRSSTSSHQVRFSESRLAEHYIQFEPVLYIDSLSNGWGILIRDLKILWLILNANFSIIVPHRIPPWQIRDL